MAYTTFSEVQSYLDMSTTGDTSLINDLIDRAQSVIDIFTGRTFEHTTIAATRYFTVGVDTDGPELFFDDDHPIIRPLSEYQELITKQKVSFQIKDTKEDKR